MPRHAVNGIREFESNDIEQVASLHRAAFGIDIAAPLERYYSYFSEQFLSRCADSSPSLVFEAEDGRILGFLGVAVRHFSFVGRKLTAALSSQFIVHPEGRRRLTAIHLLREFLNGKQDMSFTDEANDVSEKIWVALGGSVAILQGIHWILPLRPVRIACDRYAPAWIAKALEGTADIIDRVASSFHQRRFRERNSVLRTETLSTERLLRCLSDDIQQCQLRPSYDSESLSAIIERAEKAGGSLRKVLLKDKENRVVGWYLYHCKERGLAEVLQIFSRADCHVEVIKHLSFDAMNHGAIAVVGRLEPGLADPLANRLCLLFRRKYAMLVHSRFPEILNAIHSGHAFISRLEGEWCLRFA
jgi:GNAT acetyltransferase-like protein